MWSVVELRVRVRFMYIIKICKWCVFVIVFPFTFTSVIVCPRHNIGALLRLIQTVFILWGRALMWKDAHCSSSSSLSLFALSPPIYDVWCSEITAAVVFKSKCLSQAAVGRVSSTTPTTHSHAHTNSIPVIRSHTTRVRFSRLSDWMSWQDVV